MYTVWSLVMVRESVASARGQVCLFTVETFERLKHAKKFMIYQVNKYETRKCRKLKMLKRSLIAIAKNIKLQCTLKFAPKHPIVHAR